MPTDPRRAMAWLIVGTLALRLLWAATLEPSNDEAYHWLYTVHPALSYFDHPPMTAWVAQLGLALCGGWVHPLSLRLGFVLMFAGSTWMLYRWTARFFGGWAGVYAAVGLNLSAYYTAAGGAFALPDGPFLFFALLTYWQASLALFGAALSPPPLAGGLGGRGNWELQSPSLLTPLPPGEGGISENKINILNWLLVGVGFAGALLSKYHAVFLPAGVVVYVLITPGMRRVLWSPGPYLAVLIGAVGFLPVVIWNANHDWASIRFQAGRAAGQTFQPLGVLVWAVGPVLYLLPGIWFALVREAVPRVWRFGRVTGIERLLICLFAVPLGFFLVVACRRADVLLHWNLIGFVPLYVLAGKRWAEWTVTNSKRARFGLRFMAVGVLLLVVGSWLHIHFGLIRIPGKDPTDDIAGWKSVAAGLEARGLLADPSRFLITNRWHDSGQLAFAVRNRLPVVCYNSIDARGFAFWSQPEDWVGKSGYFVLVNNFDDERSKLDPTAPQEVEWVLKETRGFFRSVTLAAKFPMTRGGRPWREVRVFQCDDQLRPFPFTYTATK